MSEPQRIELTASTPFSSGSLDSQSSRWISKCEGWSVRAALIAIVGNSKIVILLSETKVLPD
jgi:hypothetical protein